MVHGATQEHLCSPYRVIFVGSLVRASTETEGPPPPRGRRRGAAAAEGPPPPPRGIDTVSILYRYCIDTISIQDFFTIFKISKNENTKITKIHDILADRMFNLVRISIFWSKSNPGTKKRIELKNSEQTSIFWPNKIDFFFDFLASPGAVPLLRTKKVNFTKKYMKLFLRFFTMEKSGFYERGAGNPGIRETGIRGGVVIRDSVISSETQW